MPVGVMATRKTPMQEYRQKGWEGSATYGLRRAFSWPRSPKRRGKKVSLVMHGICGMMIPGYSSALSGSQDYGSFLGPFSWTRRTKTRRKMKYIFVLLMATSALILNFSTIAVIRLTAGAFFSLFFYHFVAWSHCFDCRFEFSLLWCIGLKRPWHNDLPLEWDDTKRTG